MNTNPKLFVIDTNVLLQSPEAILTFGDNVVGIPMTVFQELDIIKSDKTRGDLAFEARNVIRKLAEILDGCDSPTIGVPFNDGESTLMVIRDETWRNMVDIEIHNNDDKIIAAALAMKNQNVYREVVLVTNDLNMRLTAQCAGVKAQEHTASVVVSDPDLLPVGYIELTDDYLESIPTDQITAKSCGKTHIHEEALPEGVTLNTWIYNESQDWAAVLESWTENEDGTKIAVFQFFKAEQLMKRRVAGIMAKNLQQAMAIHSLMNPDIKCVALDGEAGSGKTLIALAAAIESMHGKKKSFSVEEIIVTRSQTLSSQDEAIGFLKGSESEKLMPWLMAISDNLRVIARETKNDKYLPTNAINSTGDNEDAFIQPKNSAFFRGRSLNHVWLLVDEAQNLNQHQIKMLISRMGESSKIVLLGNLGQLDNKFLTARTSGLTYATSKLHGTSFTQVLKLEGSIRSELAAFVESNF